MFIDQTEDMLCLLEVTIFVTGTHQSYSALYESCNVVVNVARLYELHAC